MNDKKSLNLINKNLSQRGYESCFNIPLKEIDSIFLDMVSLYKSDKISLYDLGVFCEKLFNSTMNWGSIINTTKNGRLILALSDVPWYYWEGKESGPFVSAVENILKEGKYPLIAG